VPALWSSLGLWSRRRRDRRVGDDAALRAWQVSRIPLCAACGCVAFWRAQRADEQGRRRIAVNLRLAEAWIPVDRFDGLATFEGLPLPAYLIAEHVITDAAIALRKSCTSDLDMMFVLEGA